jgi:hypothetical protein
VRNSQSGATDGNQTTNNNNNNNINNSNNNSNSNNAANKLTKLSYLNNSTLNTLNGTTNLTTSGVNNNAGTNNTLMSSTDTISRNQRETLHSRFDFVKVLGKGTYGKVKLANDKRTGKQVIYFKWKINLIILKYL